ncbi:MAG: DUF1667 domain-containing protein [Spirochaetales bacterium]|nr:DUF1667 domain-containing protein [Spirochaetales bacterium]
MERQLICISCPIGCRLQASWTDETDITIEGNQCPRGEIYGREEVLAPKRVVTATCMTAGSPMGTEVRRVSVKTDAPLPKEHIDSLLDTLYSMKIPLPVETGQVLLANIGGTGVNLVATRSM